MLNQEQTSILVTGAAGYIGRHLVKRLLAENRRVSVAVRESTDLTPLSSCMDRLSVFYDDGCVEHLADFMSDHHVECVVHLATLYITYHKPSDIAPMIESNISFGARILEAMKLAGVRNILYSRTSWQHYLDCGYNPVNLYAAMKQAFEDIMKYYTQAEGFHSIILEIYDTYGEWDPRGKIINLFKERGRTGETIELSPGEQKLDYLYIDDIVSAFMRALDKMKADWAGEEEYALCSEELHTLKDVVSTFEKAYGVKLNIRWGAYTYRPREIFKPYRKLEPLDGWRPVYSLRSGFERMHEKEQGDL